MATGAYTAAMARVDLLLLVIWNKHTCNGIHGQKSAELNSARDRGAGGVSTTQLYFLKQ